MVVAIDSERAHRTARILYKAFQTTGIHGRTDMPEDSLPAGVKRGSLEHILFITLTVAVDYQRDANMLWQSSRRCFADPDTNYLFIPHALHENPAEKILRDLQKYKVSKKPSQDANTWRTVAISFFKKWQGNPVNFLADCQWDAQIILERLKSDTHLKNHCQVPDFPFLRGDKIGPLWLRMLRDNVGIQNIRNLDCVPIPVDIHIARASLALGVVRGKFAGNLADLFKDIRKAWFEGVAGIEIDDRNMIALDIDEPLWHLSKYGWTERDKFSGDCPLFHSCKLRDYCTPGKIDIKNSFVELDT